MPTMKQIIFASLLALALCCVATAQDSSSATVPSPSLTITAAASGDRVRITAPSSVVQMHVEVYAGSGEKVFDQEIRGGNVFDWHLQDGQAQRLAPGAYVCVVTAKSVSGKLTQKIGSVKVAENSASVQPADSPQLSAQQTQAIGPVEENSSWTIPGNDEPLTTTVIAHDGTDGQMIRGRGALTFRIGNFFSGIDSEQMRLTEEGNLGIGTSEPKAKLDVAGTIRAERFLVVKPKLAGDKTASDTLATDSSDSVQPLATGTGTQNQIAKWIDGAGTLGDSGITEAVSGNVGLGTTTPGATLEAFKTAGANATGGGVLVSRYNDGAGTFRGGAIYSRYISAVGDDALVFGVTSTGTKNPYSDFDQARMAILAKGNVGIGTTTPGEKLDLSGTFRASGQNIAPTSGAGVELSYGGGVGYIQSYDRSSGLDQPLYLSGRTIQLNADGQGNVGIGTASPANKLHIHGGGLTFSDPGGFANQNRFAWLDSPGFASTGSLTLDARDDSNGFVRSLLTVQHTGNVGIGTASPLFKFHVTTGADQNLVVRPGADFSGSLTGIGLQSINNGNTLYRPLDLEGSQVTLNVGSGGNVGIGIASPAEKLSVAGTVQSTSGGFRFPDGSIQITATAPGNTTFTTFNRSPTLGDVIDVPSTGPAATILHLDFPTGGTYLVTATVSFGSFQNNFRNFFCKFQGTLSSDSEDYWGTLPSFGNQTMTFHAVINLLEPAFVDLRCHGGLSLSSSDQNGVSAWGRRLTAVQIPGNFVVQ